MERASIAGRARAAEGSRGHGRGWCRLLHGGHEFTECGLWSCRELNEERERWVWMLQWGGSKERRARLMFTGGEARYWREYEALRRELYCLPCIWAMMCTVCANDNCEYKTEVV